MAGRCRHHHYSNNRCCEIDKYFRYPWQLWDSGNTRVSPTYPFFKHTVSMDSLWVRCCRNPSWVLEHYCWVLAQQPSRRAHAQDGLPFVTNKHIADDIHQALKTEIAAFVALLRACAKTKDLHRGARLHADLLRHGLLETSSFVAIGLVNMYAKCGLLGKAKEIHDGLPVQDVVSWNVLVAGYAQQGQGEEALTCFEQMQQEGITPDEVTFTCVLKACGNIGAAYKGEKIHDEIARQGLLGKDIVLTTALVDMYAKCGALAKAQEVLEEVPTRDVFSWTALIAGYARQGQGKDALICFDRMQREGLSPNAVTFTCILKACGSIGAAEKGEQIHNEVARQGLLRGNIVLGTALVDMYAKCGALAQAQQVFEDLPTRNVVSWNALIAGYAQQGQGQDALNCFERLKHEGVVPGAATFACILKACASIGAADKGAQIHDEIARQGLLSDNLVLGNALVDMYAKCGALAKALEVLDGLPACDVFSWSALIAGYVQHGQGEEALKCCQRMQYKGVSPNAVTFTCILKACGSIRAADTGEQIHDEIIRQGLLGNDVILCTALVDMYAKCGALVKAQQVFYDLPAQDVVFWNALIAGYARQGQGEQAFKCYKRLQCEGLSPTAGTFSCILKALTS